MCFVEEDVLSTVTRARGERNIYATAADKLAYDPDFGAGELEGELDVGVGVQCRADGMIENNCEAFISLRLCVWMDKCARRVSGQWLLLLLVCTKLTSSIELGHLWLEHV